MPWVAVEVTEDGSWPASRRTHLYVRPKRCTPTVFLSILHEIVVGMLPGMFGMYGRDSMILGELLWILEEFFDK